MLVEERHNMILKLLNEQNSVHLQKLKEKLSVSEATVRNDLRFLEEAGKLKRSHGGAVHISKMNEITYEQRAIVSHSEKESIGKKAAQLIGVGETIFLDAGSTVMELAKHLPDGFEYNVVTAALNIANMAGLHSNVNVHLVGGLLRPSLQELVGPKAISQIKEINAHKVFLSCSGVDLIRGLTEQHVLSAEVKKAMVESATQVILLADSTKIGKVFFAELIPLSLIDVFITDGKLSKEDYDSLTDMGVKVIQT